MARREQLMAELLSEHGAQLRTYMEGHEDLRQLLKDSGVEAGDRAGLMAERAEQMAAYREQFQNMIDSDEVRAMLAEMREELEQHRQEAGNREDMMARRQELIANMSEHRERLQEELAGNDELREMLTEKRGELMGDQRQALDELRESLGQREASADLAADLRSRMEEFKSKLEQQRNGN